MPSLPPLSVDGFPHPNSQGYSGTDRSRDRSQKRYYVVSPGRHQGVFHSWPLAWALTVGYKWGSLRGQVSGINEFGDAAHRDLQTAGNVDPYSPIPSCSPLAPQLPMWQLGKDPARFYFNLFQQPHLPSPQSWLLHSPNPGAGPSPSPT